MLTNLYWNVGPWHDAVGPQWGCDYYAAHPMACSLYGMEYDNAGMNANTACCVCGGGNNPTLQQEDAKCTDLRAVRGWLENTFAFYEWHDAQGRSCANYWRFNRCESDGSAHMNEGWTANQACCVCGGGSKTT